MMFRPVRVTLTLTVALVVIALLPALAGPRIGEAPPWFRLLYLGVAGAGSLLPFAAVAGGLAVIGDTRGRVRHMNALTIAVLTYIVAAYATPLLEAGVLGYGAASITDRLPFGPSTPGALMEWRDAVLSSVPVGYSLRVDEPLRRPPNWLGYHLYLPVALAAFCYLNFFLGIAIRTVGSRLPRPRRRYVVWAVALVWNLGYFAAANAGMVWVRGAPIRSAAVGAFLPLLIPLGLLGIYRLVQHRRG